MAHFWDDHNQGFKVLKQAKTPTAAVRENASNLDEMQVATDKTSQFSWTKSSEISNVFVCQI